MDMQKIRQNLKNFTSGLLSYFNVADDLEPQSVTEESIRSGVSFKGSQLLILIFAIFVASLGLNTDNTAVIIGAMLISPLMGPIIGMGLAIGISDYALLKRSLKNIFMAMLGSILASAVYFLISPQYEESSQLLARTSPSIYDVFIALFGGAAGIVSMASKNKGQVLPGVAIATSLMPPLCTAGYGLATLQPHFLFGALYLFFTNMVFILVATWAGVKIMNYTPVVYKDNRVAQRVRSTVYTVVALTIGVSTYLTVQMISKNIFLNKASSFVQTEMVFPNTQVLNHKEYISSGKRYIDVTLIGQALPKDSLQLAMISKLDSAGLQGTILNIHQGFSLGSANGATPQTTSELYTMMQKEITRRDVRIDSLQAVIRLTKGFSDEAVDISPEIRVLFPEIKDIALSNMILASTQSNDNDTINMVFVRADTDITPAMRERIADFVSVRLKRPSVHVSVNPHSFPWPEERSE